MSARVLTLLLSVGLILFRAAEPTPVIAQLEPAKQDKLLPGKLILFGATRAENVNSSYIMAIHAEGVGLETIFELKDGGRITKGRVSPDGQRLAYNVRRSEKTPNELWLLGSNGKPTKLANDAALSAWSSDGKSLVCYQGGYGKWKTFRLDQNGGGEETLSIPETDMVEDCSATGQLSVMATNPGKELKHPSLGTYPLRKLYTRAPDGTKSLDRSSDALDDDIESRFSPDGKHLSFHRRRHKDGRLLHSLMVLNLDAQRVDEVAQLHRLGEGYRSYRPVSAPCWSPDGTHLVAACLKHRWVTNRNDTSRQSPKWTIELLLVSPENGVVHRYDLEDIGIQFISSLDWRR